MNKVIKMIVGFAICLFFFTPAVSHSEGGNLSSAIRDFLPEGTEMTIPNNLKAPFIKKDLNNNGYEELILFYKGDTDGGILILEEMESEWKLKGKIRGYGPDIDMASFSVGDLDEDGKLEIASISRVEEEQIPTVKLQVYTLQDQIYKKDFETIFPYGGYPNQVLIGAVKEGQQGIFVDIGIGAHSAYTEIFVKENGDYRSVLAEVDEYQISQTFKPYPLYSRDINGDGIIEIGIQFPPPETDHLPMVAIPWVNHWYQWDGKDSLTSEPVLQEYSNYGEGYYFIIPDNWKGKYTIKNEMDDHFVDTALHFLYRSDTGEKAELLTLHHIAKDNWAAEEQKFQANGQSYWVVGENNHTIIVAELGGKNSNLSGIVLKEYEAMLLNQETIQQYLKTYNERMIQSSVNEHELTEKEFIKPEEAREIIEETASILMQALSTRNTEVIASLVHPIKGVRFTPYTNVSIHEDMIFQKEAMNHFFEDEQKYLWGYYDGIGTEIRVTPSEYYEKFIYSEDFINADKIGYNEVLSSGNMLENQFEVYENPIVVEYYFPGLDPQYSGMDWKSLRLVFEQHGDSWKLVGIIHNQWTI